MTHTERIALARELDTLARHENAISEQLLAAGDTYNARIRRRHAATLWQRSRDVMTATER